MSFWHKPITKCTKSLIKNCAESKAMILHLYANLVCKQVAKPDTLWGNQSSKIYY